MTAPEAAPLDLQGALDAFFARVGASRGDELLLHSSDLAGCDFATYARIHGEPQLPFDQDSRDSFLMGYAVEAYLASAFDCFVTQGYSVVIGGEIQTSDGWSAHPDVRLEKDGATFCVFDVTTTKAKAPDWKRGHALKTADYALRLGAPWFAEIVLTLGFGKVTGYKPHWFRTEDWREAVEVARERVQTIAASPEPPAMEPPTGDEWRCGKPGSGKSYCQSRCPRNAALEREEVPA